MGCNCKGKGALLSYKAKAKNGETATFDTMGEVRIFLQSRGGGTHTAVPRKK